MQEDYRGRRVLVVGLGRSGTAAVELLRQQRATVCANDIRDRSELEPLATRLEGQGVELALGGHPPGLAAGVDLVVLSPGVRPDLPLVSEARRQGIPVWGELELGYRFLSGKLVAVTGTKGKSTTCTLIRDMVRASGRSVRLAGNIGAPLSQEVLKASRQSVFVVEVSSFQLESIESFRPDVAVLLDVTADHLDWHPTFQDYLSAKQRLFSNQRRSDWAVVYGGNRTTIEMASKTPSRKLYFDLDCLEELSPHLHKEGPWIVKHENGVTTPLVSLEEFQLPGRHNQRNAMAASAAATLLGVSGEALAEALEHFETLPHALEKVADIDGVRFYNDSKATNVEAVRAALESFDAGILLILGGRFKGGDFRNLREPVARNVKRVFAIGESRQRILEALEGVVPVERCRSLESAVRKAHRRAAHGDVVLLSPAGSSFDMFRDYRERGEKFREIVHGLEARK